MPQHAPEGYNCTFCQIVAGSTEPATQPSDVVYRDSHVTAFISLRWWERNPGHVIVIPNTHYENIFDLPMQAAAHIHNAAQKIAIALKAEYACDGISTRQHNEPGGNQDVWHYHLHVFPRYFNDNLYGAPFRNTTLDERTPYAAKLRRFLSNIKG